MGTRRQLIRVPSIATRLGRYLGARAAVLAVSGIGSDAKATRALRPAAGHRPRRRSMKTFGAAMNSREILLGGGLATRTLTSSVVCSSTSWAKFCSVIILAW